MSWRSDVPPFIAAQLDYLLSRSPIPVKVDQVASGCKNAEHLDRFTLLVPFCMDYVKWDVIYNAQYPLVPPDIVFSAEDDGFLPLLFSEDDGNDRMRKSCLCDWSNRDPTRLLALVLEMRELYSQYQRKLVWELDDARLKFEINTALSREGIEVRLISGAERPEEVKFSVPLLDGSLNSLVPGCPWKEEQKIQLQVVFPVSLKYIITPSAPRLKLSSTPDLKMLFSIEDIKLPTWIDGMCLAEYIPNLEDNINEQMVEALASIGIRRRFIEALVPMFGRPLEADPVFCRSASFLSASGVFTFLVHFSIPTQFPRLQPALTLQSSSHFDAQGTPKTSPPLKDFPWSPRWEASQMVERIYDYVSDECLNFKKFCNDAVGQQ